jgi:hypothetical protein
VKFYRNEAVERQAEVRLAELAQVLARELAPPIPIDLLAEHVLRLDFLWEVIDELPGEIILGGLIPEKRLIVLNERRRQLFETWLGLERFTKGHEMGHWDLFVDQSLLDHPALPGLVAGDGVVLRTSPAGQVQVLQALLREPDGVDLLREVFARQDDPHEARAVNRYSAAISMPRQIVRAVLSGAHPSGWRELYRLAERFEVTVTAMKVRLDQLGLLHISEDGRFHRNRAEAAGQMRML